ncbi:hypothetical protein [Gluconacetobacter asukensis]|uniref:Uncharacterized protein n=1 Tax=Gluconacetobacter asukensis TaxID=1017181 RepID=A0A7W4IYC6_9PROT|nr:hypothetical protein [Gluconacetobacter asukensis]MBB2171318.1 hypothetical protein [Gluconacetobacter asukensis]
MRILTFLAIAAMAVSLLACEEPRHDGRRGYHGDRGGGWGGGGYRQDSGGDGRGGYGGGGRPGGY